MSLNNILFIERFPSLDLHGYDSRSAEVLINDFIKENQKLKNEFFTIIHGIGTGILKKTTNYTLKYNRAVMEYQISYFNQGCTIVKININK